jgi:hypothetical protein
MGTSDASENKKNLILGLDVSTSITGICVLDKDLNLGDENYIVSLDRIEFKSANNFWEKTDKVHQYFSNLKKSHNANWKIALEEPLLGFQKGMSSATTITTLMRFNGIVSYIARDIFSIDPVYVSSASARKTCGIKMQKTAVAGLSGKEQVFKHMSENDLKHVVWEKKKKTEKEVDWSRDATDAYVIARAIFLLKNN